MRSDSPTLKDVAEKAGVSVATASRALSGDHPMSARTRERVLAAVQDVGYRRDRKPRQRAPLVAVVASSLGHMVISEVVAGVEDVSAGAGRKCTITMTNADVDREVAVLHELADDDRVGAVIVVGGVYPSDRWRRAVRAIASRLRSRGTPFIFCGRGIRDFEVPGVSILDYDNSGGASAVVSLLLGRGHRTIGVIRGEPGFSTAEERQRGYREALAEFGMEFDPSLEVQGPRHSQFGAQAVVELLRRRPDTTAVFAESDALAMGVIRGARQLGLDLPGDLSVVGFDDQPGMDVLVPALTTVHMPYMEMGRRAARVALEVDQWLPGSGELLFGTHVVLRESVGAPRKIVLDVGQ